MNTNGGITANKFVMQFMAGLLNKTVINSDMANVSALGAAYLFGLKAGVYESIFFLKQLNANRISYSPLAGDKIINYYKEWLSAVNA